MSTHKSFRTKCVSRQRLMGPVGPWAMAGEEEGWQMGLECFQIICRGGSPVEGTLGGVDMAGVAVEEGLAVTWGVGGGA